MFSKAFRRLFLFLCIPLFAANSYAQDGLGGVSGKIMGNLEPVAGVEVVVMQKDKLYDKTTTDENGTYRFPYLRPGYYDVRATKTSHRTTIITKVPVSQDKWTKNDFYLGKYNNANMPATH